MTGTFELKYLFLLRHNAHGNDHFVQAILELEFVYAFYIVIVNQVWIQIMTD